MTGVRYSAMFVSAAVVALLVTTAAVTLALSGLKWLDDNNGLGYGGGWIGLLFIARALVVPVMLYVAARAGWSAIKIMAGRSEVFPPTPNSAITYFGVTALYVPLGMSLPPAASPLFFEAFLYPLPLLFLLVATIRAISEDGRLPGSPVVAPRVAGIIVAVAWMTVIGASAAYARFVLAGDVMDCFVWECPPGRTVGALGFMVAAATVTTVAIVWSLRTPTGMARQGIIGAVAFACLALLFPVTIPSLVMPYDAFVPAFFYGIAAVALLIVAVARKNADPLPLPAR